MAPKVRIFSLGDENGKAAKLFNETHLYDYNRRESKVLSTYLEKNSTGLQFNSRSLVRN